MNDDLTTRLRHQLHEQVDGWHSAPLTLESVRGRAHGIRRTRRIAAAGVAAVAVAVAAIALPIGLLGDPAGRSDAPPEIADTPTRAADPSGLLVPYVAGRTLTMPDGGERQLPRDYQEVVAWDDEMLGVTGTPGRPGYALERVAEDGSVAETIALGGSGIARNADGSAIGYVTPEAHMVVESAAGRFDLGTIGSTEGLGAVRPVRLLGGPDCDATGDCAVYFQDGGSEWLVGDGTGVPLGEGALRVRDVSESGLVTEVTSVDETVPESCSVVREWQSGTEVFETCDHTPDRFSPDGSLVTGLPTYLSGIGPSSIAILDATTGEEVAAYGPRNGYVSESASAWEDNDHLLLTSYSFDDRTWSLVRLGADGSRERVLGPTRGSDLRPPWLLAGGR